MNWLSIAWIAGTVTVIIYEVWNLNRELQRRKRAAAALEAALMADHIAQINAPVERERNEQLRREGKIW
jgi:hypothetical protein